MIVCDAHVGGHELSQKISKQITSITSNLRSLLQKYNSKEWENYPRTLTIQQVCSRDVSWMASTTETNIPLALKNKVIDLWNLRARAREEVEMLKKEMSRTVSQAYSELLKVNDYVCGNQQLNDGTVCLAKQLLVKKTAVLLLYLRKFHGYVDQQHVPPVADDLLEACLEQAHSAGMDLQITESHYREQFLLSSALDECDDSLECDDHDVVQDDIQEGNNLPGSFDFQMMSSVPGSLDLQGGNIPHDMSSVPGSLDLQGGNIPHDVSSVPGSLDLQGGSNPHDVSSVPGSLDLQGGNNIISHDKSSVPTSSELCRGFESQNFSCDSDDTNVESSDSEEDAAYYVNMSKVAKERAIQRFQVEQWRLYEKVLHHK